MPSVLFHRCEQATKQSILLSGNKVVVLCREMGCYHNENPFGNVFVQENGIERAWACRCGERCCETGSRCFNVLSHIQIEDPE